MLFFGRKLIKIASNQIREKDFRWVPYFVMCTICQIYLSLTHIQRFIHEIYQMGTSKKIYIYVYYKETSGLVLRIHVSILLSVVVLCYSKHERLRSCWDCQLT